MTFDPQISAPRYRVIERDRVSSVSLDAQLPQDHPVRFLWDLVLELDFAAFHDRVRARQGHPGRPPHRPELLFALWLLATCEGVAGARELAELCHRDLPYQWLCGGQPVNYHTLADFYADHQDPLHDLFVAHIAALRQQGVITLQRTTVDGSKVDACAHTGSFHRQPTLERHLQEAEEHVRQVEQQRDQVEAVTARQQAARRRAARQRRDRLRQAVQAVQEVHQQRQEAKYSKSDPDEARASETDPEARKMKLPDGGFRLTYNAQTVTDTGSGLIVTVAVTNQGGDTGMLGPVMKQVQQEHGRLPDEVVVDSGYADADDIEWLEREGTRVIMPPRNERKEKEKGKDPYRPKRRDTPVVAAWRMRMGTAEAQAIYAGRAQVAEWVYAGWSNRNGMEFRLRGLAKVGTEAVWQAWAHNAVRLLARRRGTGTLRARWN